MPTYDRGCNVCGHAFEIKRSMSDNSPVPCPKCKGETRMLFKKVPAIFTRNIDHPDSPLDEIPGHEKMRAQADAVVNKTLTDMGMN